MSNQTNATNVTTGKVRLSYCHLFQPYANQPNQEPKFSTTLLIPKSDIATKARIDSAIQAAIQAGVASKWSGVRPVQPQTPVWDGDGLRKNGEPFGPEAKGHWVITASSKQQQAVVDMALNPIINQTEVYSGMYARVNINFFPYFNSGNKGVGCGLGPIQKIADGEPLGGQMSAEVAFGDSAGAYIPPTPQYQPAQQNYGQPAYQQQPTYAPQAQPVQPAYPQQPVQQVQIDPITGLPMTGRIMGL